MIQRREVNPQILNLTQHPATQEQVNAGVVDLRGEELEALKGFLTFTGLPTPAELSESAMGIAKLIPNNFSKVMLGGAPWFMPVLHQEIDLMHHMSVELLYAFSERQSVEHTDDKGNVVKTNVFKHLGFITSQA